MYLHGLHFALDPEAFSTSADATDSQLRAGYWVRKHCSVIPHFARPRAGLLFAWRHP